MAARIERMEMRLTPEEKETIEKAAAIIGAETPGGWARTVVLFEARKILRETTPQPTEKGRPR